MDGVSIALAGEPFKMTDMFLQMMLVSHVVGYQIMLDRMEFYSRLHMATEATKAMKRIIRVGAALDPARLDALREYYLREAVAAKTSVLGAVETQLAASSGNLAEVRASLDMVGIAKHKPYLLNTVVRTQIHLGFAAGRMEVLQQPIIQEKMWGFEYVGIMDARIRPEHAALDGVRLPKDDSRWNEIMPPNGYNCRCDVVEIWKEDDNANVQNVPAERELEDGTVLKPGADKGWDFHPGELVGLKVA